MSTTTTTETRTMTAPGPTEMKVSKPNIGVYTNPEHDLWIAPAEPSVEDATTGAALREGEVTIAIKSTGICGSDVPFWHAGCIGPTMVVRENHILGHESAGQIIAAHPSVTSLKVGDRVAIEPNIPCFACEPCSLRAAETIMPAHVVLAHFPREQFTYFTCTSVEQYYWVCKHRWPLHPRL